MSSTLITFPYELARLPVVLIDNALSDRLAATSTTRVVLDRVIGSADKYAGALLRDREIAQRGADRLERSEKLVTASRLEEQAQARREQARETAAAGRQKAAQKRKAAQDRAASGLDEADATEARAKKAAKVQAAKTAAAKKASADQRAASRATAIDKRTAQVAASTTAKKTAVKRQAKSELEDVRKTKQTAAEARADAERLSELAAAKKQERKQS